MTCVPIPRVFEDLAWMARFLLQFPAHPPMVGLINPVVEETKT